MRDLINFQKHFFFKYHQDITLVGIGNRTKEILLLIKFSFKTVMKLTHPKAICGWRLTICCAIVIFKIFNISLFWLLLLQLLLISSVSFNKCVHRHQKRFRFM